MYITVYFNLRETKCGAINSIRRLTVYHKEVLLANLHPVIVALLTEVKNLRSQVARLAIVCMGDLFVHLMKNMDTVSTSIFQFMSLLFLNP